MHTTWVNGLRTPHEAPAIDAAFETIRGASDNEMAAFIETCTDADNLLFIYFHFESSPQTCAALMRNEQTPSLAVRVALRAATDETVRDLVADTRTPPSVLREIARLRRLHPEEASLAAVRLRMDGDVWSELRRLPS
jgi:hypothetical protein